MAADLFASLDWIWLYLVPFMLILTIIVFAHELGHYLAAKYNGVRVDVFSIGFGPEIFGFNDKSGTRWKFSWLPLGGYVKMASDADASSRPDHEQISNMTEAQKQESHFHKTVWQRIQISAAGPAANFIFSIIIFAGLYCTVGQKVPNLNPGPYVGDVSAFSPAAKAGLKIGDKMVAINGMPINNFQEMQQIVRPSPDKPLKFLVLTPQGQTKELIITPVQDGVIGLIGIGPKADHVVLSFPKAVVEAVKDTYKLCRDALRGLGQVITGQSSAKGLQGPIGIAQLTGQIVSKDFSTILFFMAFLSLNLGLINLFPIPMLDGGHLLFYAIEAIRGKPLSDKAQEVGFMIGMGLVGSLMLFSTWNDLSRLQWVQKIISFF